MKILTLIILIPLTSCVNTVSDNDARLISKLVKGGFNTQYHFQTHIEWVAIDSLENIKNENHLKRMHRFELEEHQTIDSLSESKRLIQIKLALHSFISNYYKLFYLDLKLTKSVFTLDYVIEKILDGNRDSLLLLSVQQLNEYDSLIINLKKYAREFNIEANHLGLKDSIKYNPPVELDREHIVTNYFWNINQKTKESLLSQK